MFPRVLSQLGKFLVYLDIFSLPGRLRCAGGGWKYLYYLGLCLFWIQGGIALAGLGPAQLDVFDVSERARDILTRASWFFAGSSVVSLALLIVAVPLSVRLAKWQAHRKGVKGLIEALGGPVEIPLLFWIFLLIPALPESSPGLRMALYWSILIFFVTYSSAFEISREIARQSEADFVTSLRNLGVGENEIFSRHILLGGCKEFVMAHVFNVWMALLLVEVSVGFASQYAESLSDRFNLIPYTWSFGVLIAGDLRHAQESQIYSTGIWTPEFAQSSSAIGLLALMFLSYWIIQIGILNIRQAGGMEYLEKLTNPKKKPERSKDTETPASDSQKQ